MRKLLLVLLAFIAIFTYIRALEKPEAAELREISRETGTEFTINN
jgi:hypothetical protein